MTRRALGIFLLLAPTSGAPALGAAPPAPGNALALFDAYLAEEAPSVPADRADIRPASDPSDVPPGRLLGRSSFLGFFTYRPKAYEELSSEERASLLCDPKFHAFLIATREQQDPSNLAASRLGRSQATDLAPEPEEMLRARPLFVVLPS